MRRRPRKGPGRKKSALKSPAAHNPPAFPEHPEVEKPVAHAQKPPLLSEPEKETEQAQPEGDMSRSRTEMEGILLQEEANWVLCFIAFLIQDEAPAKDRFEKSRSKLEELEEKHGGRERIKQLQDSANLKKEAGQELTPEEDLARALLMLQKKTAELYHEAQQDSDIERTPEEQRPDSTAEVQEEMVQEEPETRILEKEAVMTEPDSEEEQESDAEQAPEKKEPDETEKSQGREGRLLVPEHLKRKVVALLKGVAASLTTWAVLATAGFCTAMHLTDSFSMIVKGFQKLWSNLHLPPVQLPEHADKAVWYGTLVIGFTLLELSFRRAAKRMKEEEGTQ